MPIHLLPVSRRRFLASALYTGAGLVIGRAASAAAKEADPDRWVLLSDTHIAADRNDVERGVKMAANLERAVGELLALTPKPAGVFLNGDVALKRGEPGDYALATELLKPLTVAGLPIHFTLGNHDDRGNFRKGVLRGAGRPPLAARHVSVVEVQRANWFLLDSLERVNAPPGVLGKEQLAWLAQALDARPDKPALVMVHHDPKLPLPRIPTCLVDTEQLYAVLVPRKQVKAVVFGHTHRWHRGRHEGIHLVNLPPVAYLFDKVSPNGWVDLRLRDGGAELTLHAFDPKHAQAGERVELAWR